MNLSFVPIREDDLSTIKDINDWYILNTTATYYTEPITFDQLKEVIYFNHPRYKSYLIYDDTDTVGYCYLTHYKKRPAYDRTTEITIYLHKDHCHRGIGSIALEYLEKQAIETGLKNLVAGISADNTASLALFEKSGYIKCAHFKNVGEKFGMILDVVYYQKEI
ncbi:MAG: N-acetyltransferase family protein [Saprospiraceae bacterium]